MMIPQIARKLLNEYRPEGHFGLLFDPYMGSGTSLVEASVQGIDSIGTDINPLACLIAEVKTTRYDANRLKEFLQFLTAVRVLLGIHVLEVPFGGVCSWIHYGINLVQI